MAIGEDAASVLEQFTQDAANLPAEIAHLLEEIQAKDKILQECRSVISARDGSIQKFIKANGSLVVNPKDETYTKVILQNYDRAQILQEEKLGLSEKAGVLLDRQIKRLDIKIRDLQHEGAMTSDPPLPSLLHDSPANLVGPASAPTTGISTPLNPLSVNAGPSTTIANSGLAQFARPQPGSQQNGSSSVLSGVQPLHPLIGSSHLVNSAPTTPGSAIHLQPRQRESSAGPLNDAKRRRHNNQPGSLLATSTTIRQASHGPPTPKAGTPASARGGSAGPRAGIKKTKKVAPHQIRKSLKSEHPKKPIRKLHSGLKGSQSEEESVLSESNDTDENVSQANATALKGDEEAEELADEDEAGDDTTKYCTCQSVSYGNMVACDNDDCPYEWFHWTCVGLTKEPTGKWYCEECTKRLRLA